MSDFYCKATLKGLVPCSVQCHVCVQEEMDNKQTGQMRADIDFIHKIRFQTTLHSFDLEDNKAIHKCADILEKKLLNR